MSEPASPPLPPLEQWNLAVVLVMCGLVGWLLRLLRLLLTFLEARFAIQQGAVLHLKSLGASLRVLQHASMWHFHQLLRTQLQVSSTPMRRVVVPFEVVTASLRLESVGEQPHAGPSIVVQVKADKACVVQIFWGVRTDALQSACRMAASESQRSPLRRRRRKRRDAALRVQKTLRAVRSLPEKLSHLRRQNAPHQLNDDDVETEGREAAPAELLELSLAGLFVGDDAFRRCSTMERREHGGQEEYVATMSSEEFADARAGEAAQRVLTETDSGEASHVALSPVPAPSTEARRYACVIAIGSSALFGTAAETKRSAVGSRDATRPKEGEGEEVICQCVAIDLLPTPARHGCSPAVVKRLNFTAAHVYSPQEIFGRDRSPTGGECVICLEGLSSVILLPCRHLCVCRVCLEEIEQCPICRAKFSTYASYDNTSPGDSPATTGLGLQL